MSESIVVICFIAIAPKLNSLKQRTLLVPQVLYVRNLGMASLGGSVLVSHEIPVKM